MKKNSIFAKKCLANESNSMIIKSYYFCVIPAKKISQPDFSMRKHQTNTNLETFCKSIVQYSSKMPWP